MKYRDVPLDEAVALEHTIRGLRNALVMKGRLVSEVMRSKNSDANKRLARIERELIMLAGEIEGRGITVHGLHEWNAAERAHREKCTDRTGACTL